jgi:flavin-dependent dehydrogenase
LDGSVGLGKARGKYLIVLRGQTKGGTRVAFPGGGTDVFVIGGGPAGLAAAIAARRKGFTVTVADGAEPPIDKACGEGMMPGTQAALRELGVEVPAGAGFRFRGIRFEQGETQVAADFPEGRGIGIRRTELHELLIHAAERSGVKLLWKTPVTGIESDGVRLNGASVPTRWIIGADGSQSRVRRWSGLDPSVKYSPRLANRRHYRLRPWSEFMEIHWGPRFQAYVTPISNDEVCIVTMGETAETSSFERALSALPQLRDRLANAQLASRERGASTAMQSLARVWRGNVALVGDSSGGVDAITGEGLRLAFRQALALAQAMRERNMREYQRAHRQLARRPLQMGRLVLLLGRYGRIRSRMLRMLSRNPNLFARLLAIHVGHATPGATVATGAQLGWQFLAG